MFVASDNSDIRQLALRLVKQRFENAVLKTLEKEDEQQLRYVKLMMQEKMPKELQSRKYDVLPRTEEVKINDHFPKMFEERNKKNYEYINDDLDNIKRVAETFDEIPKNHAFTEGIASIEENGDSKVKQQLAENKEKGNGEELRPIMKQEELEKDKPKQQERKNQSSRIESKNVGDYPSFAINTSPNPVVEPSRVNPFIPNNMNFMDPNANSKALQTKYPHLTFNENSRNIAAIAHSSKLAAFSQSMSFPTTVMAGTMLAPRESSFSKDAKLDVRDVMRYTLGVKRQDKIKVKMENPFNRPPQKKK